MLAVNIRHSGASVYRQTPQAPLELHQALLFELEPPEKDELRGWSTKSANNNMKFLQRVHLKRNNFTWAYTFTFTMDRTPETSDELAVIRNRFFVMLRKYYEPTAYHWVIEWTNAKIPHLHMVILFDTPLLGYGHEILDLWVRSLNRRGYQLSFRAQYVSPIYDSLGWLRYVAKHCARGVSHYQRQGMPYGWTKTGRLWGYGGQWFLDEDQLHELTWPQFYRLRRLVAAYIKSKTKQPSKPYLRWNDPHVSRIRAISAWIPAQHMRRLVDFVKATTVPF